MRGKIIQYNGADGSGTIAAEGKQYRFALATWHGDSAPGINRVVEFVADGDAVTAVAVVGEDVLLREKAAELGGKLGALWNKIPAAASAAADETPAGVPPASGVPDAGAANGPITVQSVLQRYGKGVLIAWALFLIGSMMFNAVSISMGPVNMGKSLFDISSLLSQYGVSGGGSIKLMLILGYLSIGMPLVWRDRRAWLALAIPLLAILWATYSAVHSLGSIGDMSGGDGPSVFDFIGFGFYLSFLAAIALTVLAFKRFASAT